MAFPDVVAPAEHGGHARRGGLNGSVRISRARLRLTWALAALWLLDAALQLQPFMYTKGFTDGLRSAREGSPDWVSAPVAWSAHLVAQAQPLLNTLFALTQLVIAVGLLLPRWRKAALLASVIWALMVWWLGEGLGMLLAGPMNIAMGIPGAALLYALIAVLIWPSGGLLASSVAAASPLRAAGARSAWVGLWALFAFETLRPANRAPQVWHDMIAAMASGEPRWIGAMNDAAASLLDHRGSLFSMTLALACGLIAFGAFAPPWFLKPMLGLAVVLAGAIWFVAQDFGGIATGRATDPNSGPLLVVLAFCFWPVAASNHGAASGAGLPSGLGGRFARRSALLGSSVR